MKATHLQPRSVPVSGGIARRITTAAMCSAAGLGTALLAACASSGPSVHLHTLMPPEPPSRTVAATAPPTPLLLDLRLPPQVEQPQLLVRVPDGSLMSLEQERWASPLRDELRLALFEELGAKFGIVEARNAAGVAPPRVAIDVRRFDSVSGFEARVEGAWSLAASSSGTPGNAAAPRCEWLYRENAGGALGALPEAHRRIVVRLADAIGAAVVALGKDSPISCPVSDLR